MIPILQGFGRDSKKHGKHTMLYDQGLDLEFGT